MQENIPVIEPEKKRRTIIQLSEEEMIGKINEFKASGLTPKEYCKLNDYSMSNFYYWRKKYLEKFPEPQEKPKRGRKPRQVVEGEAPVKAKKERKAKKGRKTAAKKAKKPVVKKQPVEAPEGGETPMLKRRGRPKSAARIAAEEAASRGEAPVKVIRKPRVKKEKAVLPVVAGVKAEKAVKAEKPSGRGRRIRAEKPEKSPKIMAGASIIIRYPNGTKISVDANIDLKKLKQLINL